MNKSVEHKRRFKSYGNTFHIPTYNTRMAKPEIKQRFDDRLKHVSVESLKLLSLNDADAKTELVRRGLGMRCANEIRIPIWSPPTLFNQPKTKADILKNLAPCMELVFGKKLA